MEETLISASVEVRQRKKKISKHLFGGKPNRPFTGFEGLSYTSEAASPSTQGRANEPMYENIQNSNGNYIIGKETYYNPEAYKQQGRLVPESVEYQDSDGYLYDDNGNYSQQTQRVFDSLKRHALMNKQLGQQRKLY